jgi:hypothetical protein
MLTPPHAATAQGTKTLVSTKKYVVFSALIFVFSFFLFCWTLVAWYIVLTKFLSCHLRRPTARGASDYLKPLVGAIRPFLCDKWQDQKFA